MSDPVNQALDIESLAERYRRVTAPTDFSANLTAAVDVPPRRSAVLPAALAAAVIAAVALAVSLPVSGPDRMASPKWRVSAQTPARPVSTAGSPARLRVALSVPTPSRPMAVKDNQDTESGG